MTDLAMARVERAVSAAQRRAERIRVGMHSFIATRKEIAAAYTDRDWFTLGYASFEAYVDSEFSETRLRLSPEERREAVTELRRAGMSQRAIGSVLGVSAGTVNADLATVQDRTVPDRITGTDGREQPGSRPTSKPTETPGPDSAAPIPPADPGATPAPVADAPRPSREPGPAAKPTLTLVPDPAQVKADEQRDARAHLRRIVELAWSPNWPEGQIEHWAQQLGPYDDELSELVRRAHNAIAVLDELIERCGR